ncbi:DM13 domain-containing protein [Leifsonia soli]|uniref:ABC-type oligopeptide transport system substrate-binding subunit n=1 Tax=Leifsonia soli TaxID=582665 RepID=A0A852T5I7_9MICO|nr:DM13 domain-containing protein [Leifsonia soli]NYD76063.1 ABC-type oligopeptide transport system substrate-binding subunit [Leifsonia soli]
MRKTLALAAAVVALTAGLTACSGSDGSTSSDPATTSAASSSSTATLTGTFSGLNGKKVAGTVMISGDTIRLSGFSSDEGPDLHLYLTNGTDESAVAAGKEIMSVAHDKADQTFSLKGIDVSRYANVVVHCDKAKATFGAASLS